MPMQITRVLITAAVASISLVVPSAQTAVTSPKTQFGFNLGDDYQLVNYTQLADYWRKLDAESDRMVLQEIGKTSEGRPHLMAIVTSPANHKQLAKYRDISRRLALAEGIADEQARAMARDGKAVVWIDGGLHANETLGAQQLTQMVYEMTSRTDPETMRFLDDCIVLFVHANPDGHELVANWYMRNQDPKARTSAGLPRLYHKYIGHDNNRDFFASTQAETENINRVLYHEWLPQILYNHHQSGPAGTVVWSSPQRDPYNYNLDPLLILGLQALGTHMHQRLAAEGKPGATMASGGPYDGWWN
ncbi:MAG TPA: M14 metallopeptidase family protein, partial [Vicinamibacterales bacterium]